MHVIIQRKINCARVKASAIAPPTLKLNEKVAPFTLVKLPKVTSVLKNHSLITRAVELLPAGKAIV